MSGERPTRSRSPHSAHPLRPYLYGYIKIHQRIIQVEDGEILCICTKKQRHEACLPAGREQKENLCAFAP
jgi:hypothetical protein